jgi:multiple sugar transport system permease protein
MKARAGRGSLRRRSTSWLRPLLLVGAALAFLVPLIWTGLASFGVVPDNSTWPPHWYLPPSLDHYAEIGIAEPTFVQELATSTGLGLLATALTLGVSFLAAYGLARSFVRSQRLLAQGFLILACLPVMAYAVPLTDTVEHLHLEDTFFGVMLAQAAVFSPLAIYILYGYLSQVPRELEESVRLDGGSTLQVIRSVALPFAAPGLAATGIIVFVLNWNLLLVPMVLITSHIKTIPVAMSDFFTFERELEWPTAAAALTTSLVPLVLLIALAHRLLEEFRLPFSEPESTA